MPRVLIVSPHFAPVNAPDMHRVRLALPHLTAQGWESTVLAIAPDLVEGANLDPQMTATLPERTTIVYSRGIPFQWTRKLGFGSIWLRCGHALRRAGERLLAAEKFDLVFISTSQFDAFRLGPRWEKQFGVPYVVDLQDPWVTDHYRAHGEKPPGGRWRYGWAQFQARRHEPAVMKHAAGIICVSPHYFGQLKSRYPGLTENRMRVLPFGASPRDLEVALKSPPFPNLIESTEDLIHHVYTGRCTDGMRPGLDILFAAFARFLETDPASARRHRFHFIGTNYAPAQLAEPTVLPAATAAGVAAYVAEHTSRVPYFQATFYSATADSVLVLGSSDSAYNASKLEGSLLTQNPLLLIAHRDSPMMAQARKLGMKHSFAFAEDIPSSGIAAALHQQWFADHGFAERPSPQIKAQGYTATRMTEDLVTVFNAALRSPENQRTP